MNFIELFIVALSLSMDAFAVAVGIGLCAARVNIKKAAIVGLYFGGFQAGMPVIGYFAAMSFAERVAEFSHWIVIVIFVILGTKMICGSFKKEECDEDKSQNILRPARMIPLAVATSIDAMAMGVTFAFLRVSIAPAAWIIGLTTFAFSVIGVKIGCEAGSKFKAKATLIGGLVLVLMGVWVLVDSIVL